MQLYKSSGRVVWLMPCPDESALWHRAISSLSGIYKTPVFQPHITLGRLPDISADDAISKLTRFSRKANPARVPLSRPICTDELFQKVIIPLEDSFFKRFSSLFDETFGNESAQKRNFHLSLMYGTLSCSQIDLGRVCSELPNTKYLYIQQAILAEITGYPGDWKVLCKRSL
jgi:hypothetical protein